MENIDDADMYGNLSRAQAAKMLSRFAIEVLGKTPDNEKICAYPDSEGL